MTLDDELRHLRHLRSQVQRQLAAPQTFGERLRELRRQSNMTLDDLARAAAISKPYLSQVENAHVDPPRDDKVRRLEEVSHLQPGSLVELAHLARVPDDVRRRLAQLHDAFSRAEQTVQTLIARLPDHASPPSTERHDRARSGHADSTSPAEAATDAPSAHAPLTTHPVRHAIPIINRVAAGYPADFTDLDYPAGVADDYLGAPPGLDDPHTFAVRVVGDSMEPRYHEGDIVLFSPAAAVQSGDDCYVRFAHEAPTEGATFKRVYFDTPDTARLQPLNDRYPSATVALTDVAALYKAVYRYEPL